MSELVFYVMQEKVKRRMSTRWKLLFIMDAIIIAFVLGLLIYLKGIYI